MMDFDDIPTFCAKHDTDEMRVMHTLAVNALRLPYVPLSESLPLPEKVAFPDGTYSTSYNALFFDQAVNYTVIVNSRRDGSGEACLFVHVVHDDDPVMPFPALMRWTADDPSPSLILLDTELSTAMTVDDIANEFNRAMRVLTFACLGIAPQSGKMQ